MHTVIVIGGGIVLLVLAVLIGRASGGAAGIARWAVIFIPVWLVLAAINLWVGVSHAGYTVMEEMPIFLVVFGGPAIIAIGVALVFRNR